MNLSEYLEKTGETQSAFALRAGVPVSTINQIIRNKLKRTSPETAKLIEVATGGQVGRMSLLYPEEFKANP